MRSPVLIALLALSSTPLAAHAQDAPKPGAVVPKLRLTDIRYLPRSLDDFGPKKAFVLVFLNTSCPLAGRYLPTLQEMEREYRAKDVQFIGANAAEEDSIVAMATQAAATTHAHHLSPLPA